MKLAAGFLIIDKNTNKILLTLRNDPIPAWSVFGGMLEKYETPIQCAKRELIEEANLYEDIDYIVKSNRAFHIGRYNNFVYRTYIAYTVHNIIPKLNHENLEYNWFSLDELPDNIHFGLNDLLSDEKTFNKLKLDLK